MVFTHIPELPRRQLNDFSASAAANNAAGPAAGGSDAHLEQLLVLYKQRERLLCTNDKRSFYHLRPHFQDSPGGKFFSPMNDNKNVVSGGGVGLGMGNSIIKGPTRDCDYYTDSLCLKSKAYPSEEILSVLDRNVRIGNDLVADVVDQASISYT